MLTFWELAFWELTFWEVDILGVDISGVDILGVDILRLTDRVYYIYPVICTNLGPWAVAGAPWNIVSFSS